MITKGHLYEENKRLQEENDSLKAEIKVLKDQLTISNSQALVNNYESFDQFIRPIISEKIKEIITKNLKISLETTYDENMTANLFFGNEQIATACTAY